MNYIPLRKFSLTHRYFAYVDTKDNLADDIFCKYEITVKFEADFIAPDEKYKIVICGVRKKDVNKFFKAMEELPNKILLCGNNDYTEFCDKLAEKMSDFKEGKL